MQLHFCFDEVFYIFLGSFFAICNGTRDARVRYIIAVEESSLFPALWIGNRQDRSIELATKLFDTTYIG